MRSQSPPPILLCGVFFWQSKTGTTRKPYFDGMEIGAQASTKGYERDDQLSGRNAVNLLVAPQDIGAIHFKAR